MREPSLPPCLLRALATLCTCLFLSFPALAFGPQGHRVTALLAQEHLTPAAASAVRAILDGESLVQAATWADEMRGDPDHPSFWGYEHSANWHFINIPPGRSYRASPKHPRGDAYSALLAFITVLRGDPLPAGPIRESLGLYLGDLREPAAQARLRAFALRFLVHLAADLHQPLHLGYEEDRGGNDVQVRWFGRPSNLHRVWDSQLLGAARRSDTQWLRRLEERAQSLGKAVRREIARAPPEAWLSEGLVLREEVYAVERFDRNFRRAYARAYAPLLERQLLKAGLRLAALLNAIFGDLA